MGQINVLRAERISDRSGRAERRRKRAERLVMEAGIDVTGLKCEQVHNRLPSRVGRPLAIA